MSPSSNIHLHGKHILSTSTRAKLDGLHISSLPPLGSTSWFECVRKDVEELDKENHDPCVERTREQSSGDAVFGALFYSVGARFCDAIHPFILLMFKTRRSSSPQKTHDEYQVHAY